jgi:hypothetical protein
MRARPRTKAQRKRIAKIKEERRRKKKYRTHGVLPPGGVKH